MDDVLLDTSWTTHHVTVQSDSYKRLFSSSSSSSNLEKYSTRLQRYLTSQTTIGERDDFDDQNERLGPLKENIWTTLSSVTATTSGSSNNTRKSDESDASRATVKILINLDFQKQSYRFVLYGPNLILSRATPRHTKHVLDFLTDTFAVSASALKLSQGCLKRALANYLSDILFPFFPASSSSSSGGSTEELMRLAVLKTAVGTLKITLSFSGPVAPDLRTADVGIDHQSINSLLEVRRPEIRNLEANIDVDANVNRGSHLLRLISESIAEQSGVILPLEPSAGIAAEAIAVEVEKKAPVRITRISTTAWAMGVEGKIKISAKAVDGSDVPEECVRAIRGANAGLLDQMEKEATARVDVEDEVSF